MKRRIDRLFGKQLFRGEKRYVQTVCADVDSDKNVSYTMFTHLKTGFIRLYVF